MRRLAATIASVLALTASASGARADVAIQLVVDGSGSMWGQLGGLPKTIVVREGVKPLLDRMERQNVRLGLTVFGTLASTGCDNVDTPIPPAPIGSIDLPTALTNMNPKGLSPVVEAVKRAATQIDALGGKRVVIVIADGGDGCVADPCAAMRAWHATSAASVYVLGLAISENEADQQLACLAEAGGGAYANVSTIRSIEDTLKGWIDKVVAADRDERAAADRAHAETERIRQATHLKVELRGSLPDAYCREVEVVEAKLDGQPLALDPSSKKLSCALSTTIYDSIADPGNHTLDFTYRKRSAAGDVSDSAPLTLPVAVAPSQTTTVMLEARAGWFHYRTVPSVASASSGAP